jgi:anti-sigma B factor antagonist
MSWSLIMLLAREVRMVSHELPFSVNVVHEDDSLVLALAGDLDIATGTVLRQAAGELLSPHLQAVTLDLAGLDFVDVAGLRALVEVKKMTSEVQAAYRLQSVSHRARRVMRLADFHELESVIDGNPAGSAV